MEKVKKFWSLLDSSIWGKSEGIFTKRGKGIGWI